MTTRRIRRRIDFATGDYVVTGGQLEHDDTIMSSVVLALRTKRGSCAVMPELGSRLFQIRKLTRNAGKLAERYVHEALRHLVERREVLELAAKATIAGDALLLEVSYRDRSGVPRTLSFDSALVR